MLIDHHSGDYQAKKNQFCSTCSHVSAQSCVLYSYYKGQKSDSNSDVVAFQIFHECGVSRLFEEAKTIIIPITGSLALGSLLKLVNYF